VDGSKVLKALVKQAVCSLFPLSLSSIVVCNPPPSNDSRSVAYQNAKNNEIQIIAGGGVRCTNAGVIKETGVPWLHSSAVVDGSDEANREEIEGLVRACAQ